MKPADVRNILGVSFKSFKRTPASEFPCDYFESLGVFVYYKQYGIVEAIEFALPAEPVFESTNLLSLSFKELKRWLKIKDSKLEVDVDSLTSNALGIGAYAPNAEEDPDLPVESVILFEHGYYN
jgi:hypothetical protein